MTTSLVSLLSILTGIIGANITGLLYKKYSFGLTGNTIAGVFGSILLIKSLGRLGFDPKSIVQINNFSALLLVNLVISFLGGGIAVVLIHKLKTKLNSSLV